MVSRQLSADRTLLTEGLIFTDPQALKHQSFYQYTAKALDNVRRSVGADIVKASKERE